MTISAATKERLIEQYRDCNTDHGSDWFDSTFDDFIEQLAKVGIDVDKSNIQFSGFWSQGDGASFTFSNTTAQFLLDKCREFLIARNNGTDSDGGELVDALVQFARFVEAALGKYALSGEHYESLEYFGIYATRTGHHYSHSGTVTVYEENELHNSPLLGDAVLAFEREMLEFAKDADDQIEAIANALYSSLESEHEDLTSDEAVWEAIEANGWHLGAEDEDEESEEEACA